MGVSTMIIIIILFVLVAMLLCTRTNKIFKGSGEAIRQTVADVYSAAADLIKRVKTTKPVRSIAVDHWAMINEYQRNNSWGIVSEKAIDEIYDKCKEDRILSVGAGNGTWEYLLQEKGLDITATDLDPSTSSWHKNPDGRYPIVIHEYSAAHAVEKFKFDTLMSVWPHPIMKFGSVVASSKPKKIIYVGEGVGDSTADDEFFDIVDKDYSVISTIDGPLKAQGWPEKMIIYLRN